MYFNTTNTLGIPPTPIAITSADWRTFLGRDSASMSTLPFPQYGDKIRATDPIYGEATFVLAYGVAGLQIGDAVVIGAGYTTTRALTTSRGIVGISMSANIDPTALSWFAVYGQVPGRLLAAGAALPLYTSATAGSLTTTVVATQGVTAGFSLTALAATIGTKLVGTTNGSNLLAVRDIDGLYVGCGVTGTGIPAATTVTAIGYGGLMLGTQGPPAGFVQLSANCTANGNVTGTFAHGAAFALLNLGEPVASGLG